MHIDHVIYGTSDLDGAAARVQAELGLSSVAGGRHDGLGTHNRVVPLEDGSFLELLAVADPDEASGSALGAALQRAIARGEGLVGWAVAVADVHGRGAPGDAGHHRGPAGHDRAPDGGARGARGALPAVLHRTCGRSPPAVVAATGVIEWLEVGGDADRLARWLGGGTLPVRVVGDEPRVRAIGVGARELRTAPAAAPPQ